MNRLQKQTTLQLTCDSERSGAFCASGGALCETVEQTLVGHGDLANRELNVTVRVYVDCVPTTIADVSQVLLPGERNSGTVLNYSDEKYKIFINYLLILTIFLLFCICIHLRYSVESFRSSNGVHLRLWFPKNNVLLSLILQSY